MKRATLIALIAASAFAGGEGDLYLGGCAMQTAQQTTWNIAEGPAAMYGASNAHFNVSVGLRAGEFLNGSSNVLIGARSGKGSVSLTNSVGIGTDSLRVTGDGRPRVDVNGMVRAGGGEILLSTERYGSPELAYSNGTLRVRGSLVLEGSLVFTNGSYSSATDATIGGFDYYVDGVKGSDEDDGTLMYPFRTLDAALYRVQADGARICVRAGTYDFPTYFKKGVNATEGLVPYIVDVVGVDGRDRTVIRNDTGGPAWVMSKTSGMCYFKGITFEGFQRGDFGAAVAAFTFLYFDGCAFRGTTATVRGPTRTYTMGMFNQCILVGCDVYGCEFTSGVLPSGANWSNRVIFYGCYLEGCRIAYSSPDGSAYFAVATQITDCFADIDRSWGSPRERDGGSWNPSFADGRVYNSTLLIGECGAQNNGTYYSYSALGIGGSPVIKGMTQCVTNTPEVIRYNLEGYTFAPSVVRANPILRFCGYGVTDAIETKNGILSSVAQAIVANIPAGAAQETVEALEGAAGDIAAEGEQPVPQTPQKQTGGTGESGGLYIPEETEE